MLARQQGNHDLVRRNTHQSHLRQKLKYDRVIRAKAYQAGELVWVFCRYVRQKGSRKLIRASASVVGRVVHVLQDGHVYILDTCQKVHFVRLKPHQGGSVEFVTKPLEAGEIVVVVETQPERFFETINDDISEPSYRSEQVLSEASKESLPSRKRH